MLSPRKRIRGRSDGGGDGVMAMGMMQSERERRQRNLYISASSTVLYIDQGNMANSTVIGGF